MHVERDAWSHAYQPGEIKNLFEPEAVDYLVQRGVDEKDAHELFQVSRLLALHSLSAVCATPVCAVHQTCKLQACSNCILHMCLWSVTSCG